MGDVILGLRDLPGQCLAIASLVASVCLVVVVDTGTVVLCIVPAAPAVVLPAVAVEDLFVHRL